jgi:hypothetical protein
MNTKEKDIIKEGGVSAIKIVTSYLPLGNVFNELFFEFRGRIQQKRLNIFVEEFQEFINQGGSLTVKNIFTERFSDLFELVVKNVVSTSSEEKIKHFRNVLINQINNPESNMEDGSTYVELISSLSEKEINILSCHRYFDEEYSRLYNSIQSIKNEKWQLENQLRKEEKADKQGFANNSSKVQTAIANLENTISSFETKQEELMKYNTCEFYKIDEMKFIFYKQRLFSKGLLIELNPGPPMYHVPFQHMRITDFGKEFLNFIMEMVYEPHPAEVG